MRIEKIVKGDTGIQMTAKLTIPWKKFDRYLTSPSKSVTAGS